MTSAVAAIHPVTFAIPLFLFCIWFLDTERLRPVRRLRRARDVDGRADGAADRRARDLVRARARTARGRSASSRSPASRGRSSPSTSSCPRSPARTASSSGSTTRSAARRRASSGCSSPIPERSLAALFEAPRHRRTSSGSGCRCSFCSCSRRGLRAVALPQLLANGLSDFRSMTDPRYHSVAAVDSLPDRRDGLRRRARRRHGAALAAAGRARLLGRCSRSSSARGPRRRRDAARWARERPAPHVAGAARGRRARTRTTPRSSRRTRPARTSRRAGTSTPSRSSDEPTWAVVDLDDPWVVSPDSPHPHAASRGRAGVRARLERDPAWRKVFERDGVLVFRR